MDEVILGAAGKQALVLKRRWVDAVAVRQQHAEVLGRSQALVDRLDNELNVLLAGLKEADPATDWYAKVGVERPNEEREG